MFRPSYWLARLDPVMEKLVLTRPTGRQARQWRVLIVALLAVAAATRWLVGPYPMVDLFMLPVLVSCVVFQTRGLAVLPVSLIAFHLTNLARGQLGGALLWLSDLTQLLEWSVLACFVLVTLNRYGRVKRLEHRIHQDLEMARTLQAALTQPVFDFGRLKINGLIRQSADVGGDFYYFRPFQQNYAVFCLGDVMGKGISASLLMAVVMGFLFEWGKKSASPAVVLDKLNQRMLRLAAGDNQWFLTMMYAVFNEDTGELAYAGAGHQSALVMRVDGRLEVVEAAGLPLGIMETEFPQGSIRLDTGDRVVLYTDGVTEARARSGDLFGLERLMALLQAGRQASSEELLGRIEEAVRAHTEDNFSDDLAVLIAQVK